MIVIWVPHRVSYNLVYFKVKYPVTQTSRYGNTPVWQKKNISLIVIPGTLHSNFKDVMIWISWLAYHGGAWQIISSSSDAILLKDKVSFREKPGRWIWLWALVSVQQSDRWDVMWEILSWNSLSSLDSVSHLSLNPHYSGRFKRFFPFKDCKCNGILMAVLEVKGKKSVFYSFTAHIFQSYMNPASQ